NSKKIGTIASNGIFLGSAEAQLRQLIAPLLRIGRPKVTIQTMPYLDAWLHFALPTGGPTKIKFFSAFVYDALPPQAIALAQQFIATNPSPEFGDLFCLNWGGVLCR